MSPIAVYASLLRQSLSLVLELTVSSGRLAGHQGPASLHLSRRHTVVTPCCCTCRLGAEPRSPGLRTHALACQSFSLPSCLLLNHIFFSNLNLSTTSLLSNRLPTSPYILMELFSLSLKFCILYGRNQTSKWVKKMVLSLLHTILYQQEVTVEQSLQPSSIACAQHEPWRGEKRLMLGEELGSSSQESLTPGIILLWHIYLWHFKDIMEAMLSWRDRMVQGKRKHPSIWWPPRTSNICT